MKSQISLLILGVMMLSMASAIFPNENATVDLSSELTQIDRYYVQGNSSPIITNLTGFIFYYKIPADYPAESFKIVFEGWRENNSVTYVHSGGGGCITNYTCSEWAPCAGGTQTRTCTKDAWKGIKDCYARPVSLSQNCTEPIKLEPKNDTLILTPETPTPTSTKSNGKWILFFSIIFIAIAVAVWLILRKMKGGNKKNDFKETVQRGEVREDNNKETTSDNNISQEK